jgi:hypothetical protein
MDDLRVKKLKEEIEKSTPTFKLFEDIKKWVISIAATNEAILRELKKLSANLKK